MAIYGIGSSYEDSKIDMTNKFIQEGVACIGWDYDDTPPLHNMMRKVKVGDIIFIKSYYQYKELRIKAVGIVVNDNIRSIKNFGKACIDIKWIWTGQEQIDKKNDKYDNVRTLTMYEELNPEIQKRILQLLFSRL